MGALLALAIVAPVMAADTATDQQGRTLTVSRSTDLDPDGETVTVTGFGYTETKGIYVAFCIDNGPGQRPEPCGGGIDTTGESGASVWISSNPPPYGRDLAVPYEPSGSFEVRIRVAGTIGDHDCHVDRCAVVTRNDHLRTDDRSQDLAIPVTFRTFNPIPIAIGAVGVLGMVGIIVWATRRRRAATALVAALLLAGCGGTAATSSAVQSNCGPATAEFDTGRIDPIATNPTPELPVTVPTADGGEVTITDISRILPVNLYGSIAEIVFHLGLGDNVVGRDTSTTFDAAAHLPNVTGGGHELSAEAILDLNPTVVLTDASIGPPEAVDQIRAAGIPVVLLDDAETLEGLPGHIRAIAIALGVPDVGEQLVERVQTEIAAASSHLPTGIDPPTIAFLYIRGTAGVYLIGGEGAGPDAMIEGIGAIDAGTKIGLTGFRPITSEALINAAPDAILMMTEGLASVGGVDGLLEQPGVGQTPAGEQRRVIDMDDGILLNFGARTGRAMASLADAVYGSCR